QIRAVSLWFEARGSFARFPGSALGAPKAPAPARFPAGPDPFAVARSTPAEHALRGVWLRILLRLPARPGLRRRYGYRDILSGRRRQACVNAPEPGARYLRRSI